jgi:hypothetical protein
LAGILNCLKYYNSYLSKKLVSYNNLLLQRDKLEPLGINMEIDKVKMVSSKKPTDRKAVKKAYEDAIMHR